MSICAKAGHALNWNTAAAPAGARKEASTRGRNIGPVLLPLAHECKRRQRPAPYPFQFLAAPVRHKPPLAHLCHHPYSPFVRACNAGIRVLLEAALRWRSVKRGWKVLHTRRVLNTAPVKAFVAPSASHDSSSVLRGPEASKVC